MTRWLALRNLMRAQKIETCLYPDSDVLLRLYQDKSGYDWDKISSHYHIRQKYGLGGGVCDMTLLEYFGRKRSGFVGEMMHVHRFYKDPMGMIATTFDHIISASDQGYTMKDDHKILRFKDGAPWGTLIWNGSDLSVRFNSLHCQGASKNLIPRLFKEAYNV